MKRLSSYLILILFFISIVSTKVWEPKWFKSGNNKMFFIEINYKFTWYEALLQCALKKMSLVTLETEEELDDLAALLKEENFTFNAPHLWVGAVGIDRQFVWVANSQPVFTNKWITGNPDNWNNEENCLHFWENTTELNDRKCDLKYGFICEENAYLSDAQAKHKSVVLNMFNSYKK